MARQRLIRPEFFQHDGLHRAETVSALPLRVAYTGLWCQADRRGLFEWRPARLKLNILPYDDCDFERVLTALEEHGFITSYVVDGQRYGCIPKFGKHQTFHHAEKPDKHIPAPPAPDSAPPKPRASTGSAPDKPSANPTVSITGTGTSTGTVAVTVTRGADQMLMADSRSGEELAHLATHAALSLTVAANQAIALRWGEQPSPLLPTTGATHKLAVWVIEAEIPLEFAQQSIARQVANRPADDAPPRSMAYFRPGIEQHWEAKRAHDAAAAAGMVVPLSEGTAARPRKPTSFYEVA